MNQQPATPESYRDEMTEYLLTLRDSGKVNMMDASRFLARDFKLDKPAAKRCLLHWMRISD